MKEKAQLYNFFHLNNFSQKAGDLEKAIFFI